MLPMASISCFGSIFEGSKRGGFLLGGEYVLDAFRKSDVILMVECGLAPFGLLGQSIEGSVILQDVLVFSHLQ